MIFFSVVINAVMDLLLRPLLLTAEAAATTAFIYCCFKRDDGEQTTVPQVYEQTTEPALVRPTEVVQDQMMACERDRETHRFLQEEKKMMKTLAHEKELLKVYEREQEAHIILQAENSESIIYLEEENNEKKRTLFDQKELLKATLADTEKDLETIHQLEMEKTHLIKHIEELKGSFEDMEKQLLDKLMQCVELVNEREAHSILHAENYEIKKTITQLEEKNSEMKKTLIQKEELLKLSQAEGEEKHQKDEETIIQLQKERSDLANKVEILRDTVEELDKEFFESIREYDEITNATLADAEKDLETIHQLEMEKNHLTKHIEELKGSLEDMEKQLLDKLMQCVELVNDREAHSILHAENDEMKKTITHLEEKNSEMKKTLIQKEELLKLFLAEGVEKHQKDEETITQLQKERSDLTKHVEILRDTVKELDKEFFESIREFDELTNATLADAEKDLETIHQLEMEKTHLTKHIEELKGSLEDMEKQLLDKLLQCVELVNERKAHSILQAENDEMKKTITQLEEKNSEMKKTLIQKEEFLKLTLAEGEEKHQKDVETITQLEKERSDLTKQVEILRDTVEELENESFEFDTEYELMNECEREWEVHSLLQTEYNELKKMCSHQEELLKLSLAEGEEKHQKDVETITQLEKERSDLANKVEILRDTVEELDKEFFESIREYDELTNATLADAEKDLETIHQLEMEKTHLTIHIEELKGSLEDMEKQLLDKLMQCVELVNEREAQSILHAENDEMKKTITQLEEKNTEIKKILIQKELLKLSQAEGEEKHQNDVEAITQLQKERSDLTNKVEILRDTVEELDKEFFESIREYDEITNILEKTVLQQLQFSG
ncbi:myosin-11-like isoform X2 [Tachysurus fulvidraco]|uniref:myosin-11-like isoform X2 n=1 Tax=Tachysurus fulvidraco TaxID=1234273 RepID=UPI001FEE5838|nr:myosin-11-like isoform X2 [Tachysurus fulvidraco]